MFSDLPIGIMEAFAGVLETARRAAEMRAPILIQGPSGIGKEVLARYIHQSRVPGEGFLRVYCGHAGETAPEALLRPAPAGTLFLKHVHLLAASQQERLVTQLESGEGVQWMSSTTAGEAELLQSGRFSADLYFRLSAVRIVLPPLAVQPERVSALLKATLERMAGPRATERIDARLADVAMRYSWPGNLRELANFVRALAIAPDPAALVAQLEQRCGEPAACDSLKTQVRHASRQLEREIILRTLDLHQWNRRRAARALQISYRSLLYKIKDLNLTNSHRSGSFYV